jgi:hypothetical protein
MAGESINPVQPAAGQVRRPEQKFAPGAVDVKSLLTSLSGTLKTFREKSGAEFEWVDLVFPNAAPVGLKPHVDGLIKSQDAPGIQTVVNRLKEVNTDRDHILTGTPQKPGIISLASVIRDNFKRDPNAKIESRIQVPMVAEKRPQIAVAGTPEVPKAVAVKGGAPVEEQGDVAKVEYREVNVTHFGAAEALNRILAPDGTPRYAVIITAGYDPKTGEAV